MNSSENTEQKARLAPLRKYVAQTGAEYHIQALFAKEIVEEAYKSNKKRLQTTFTYDDTVGYAVANRIVENFLKKNPQLKLTQETLQIEKNGKEFKFSSRGSLRNLQLKHDFIVVQELLRWNDSVKEDRLRRIEQAEQERLEEEQRRKEAEEEEQRQKQLELERAWREKQKEQERITQEQAEEDDYEQEEEEKPERKNIVKIITDRDTSLRDASSVPGPTIRIVQKKAASLLPDGSRSPPHSRGPRSPGAKSVMQISYPAGSVVGSRGPGEARSVGSMGMRRRNPIRSENASIRSENIQ